MPKKTFFNLLPEKKQKIIDATYDIFINEKYENVTIRGISSKAGISIGSFYQYFHDKDELYLYLQTNIEKKYYAKQKEKFGNLFLRKEAISLEEVCTKKEIDFNRTWYWVPIEVMRKFYFGKYGKELNSFIMDELIELKASGKLKDCVDIQLIFHFYVTSMFNMLIYFREHNITDEDEKFKIKTNFYKDILLNGILKAE